MEEDLEFHLELLKYISGKEKHGNDSGNYFNDLLGKININYFSLATVAIELF